MDSGWSWSPSRPLANIGLNALNANNGVRGMGGLNQVPPALQLGKENASTASKPAPKSTGAKTTSAAASRKRKSDAIDESEKEDLFPKDVPEISDHDDRLRVKAETCNAVRRKIRAWIESGAQKVKEFQDTIGVSPHSYQSFMNRTQAWDGQYTDTYLKAMLFFKKRQLQGLPLKATAKTKGASGTAKKPKQAVDSKKVDDLLEVSHIKLPGEDEGDVSVYDTCDEVRKKIRAFVKRDGITQAALLRAMAKCHPDGRPISSQNLQYFLGQKGPLRGNTSRSFYAGYVFFEKLRIKQSKPKTDFREEMEAVHGWQGVDIETPSTASFICSADSRPYINEYAQFVFGRF